MKDAPTQAPSPVTTRHGAARWARWLGIGGVVTAAIACSNASDTGSSQGAATCDAPGGPVSGDTDTHCVDSSGGDIAQSTSQASCAYPTDAAGLGGGDGGAEEEEEAPTRYGTAADGDDCKYHVEWSATPVCENGDVTFTVTATNKTDGSPVVGASPRAQVYLDETHPAPHTDQQAVEKSPGVYEVGPIHFDAKGRWIVRFHFFETCADIEEDSPHGHVAFYVDVP